jgi:hypothetical protein
MHDVISKVPGVSGGAGRMRTGGRYWIGILGKGLRADMNHLTCSTVIQTNGEYPTYALVGEMCGSRDLDFAVVQQSKAWKGRYILPKNVLVWILDGAVWAIDPILMGTRTGPLKVTKSCMLGNNPDSAWLGYSAGETSNDYRLCCLFCDTSLCD